METEDVEIEKSSRRSSRSQRERIESETGRWYIVYDAEGALVLIC